MKGVVELLGFSKGVGAVGVLPELMLYYVSSYLNFLLYFPNFICLLQEQPDLSSCLSVKIYDSL